MMSGGWAGSCGPKEQWAAIVTGRSRPRVGEVFWLFLYRRREWVSVAVTDVVDGRPGHWLVRKQFLGHDEEVRLPCVNGAAAERVATAA